MEDSAEEAEKLKFDGNYYFSKGRFHAAVEAYTQAITLRPDVAIYWTNRALCHRRLGDWKRVEEDCRRAIQLDGSSFKGHYMLGLALHQKKEYNEGVKELEKALDLGRGANPTSYIVEEIWEELANVKYSLWEKESTQRLWELQNLKQASKEGIKQRHLLDSSLMEENKGDAIMKQLEALEKAFDKAAEDDIPKEVPDHLCCRISLEILRDPVITPSGITYERAVILDHLKKVGEFDPVTRQPLEPSQLIPNLAVKEAVDVYLRKHGWAYKSG